jgi:hypothetical protein
MKRIVLLLLLLPVVSFASAESSPAKKYLDITVMSNGRIHMWPDTLSSAELGSNVEERLWKSYLGTGKMYDEIRLKYENDVTEKQKADVLKAIREGQSKALTEVCLQKNKKRFEELSPRQQKKIRHQFPVLFQNMD